MNNWKETTLGEIAKNVSRRFDFSNKGKVVFVNTGDVQEGKFLHKKHLNSEGLPGQAKKALKKGDILLSEIRPANKRYALVDFEADDYVVSTKFMVISGNELVDPKFLYLFLTSKYTLQEFQVIAESRSGTFPQITFDSVANFPILLPSIKEQKEIAAVLSSLDDKIELLREQNKTLEATAQTIFKEWFVNFNFPDENEKPYKNAGGKMIGSELGEIPEGWRVGKLGEIAFLKSGLAFKGEDFVGKSNTRVLKIKDLKGRGEVNLEDISFVNDNVAEQKRVKYFKLDSGDIVLAMSGNTTGKIGIVPAYLDNLFLNQRVGKFFMKNNDYKNLLYLFLMSGDYETVILNMGYGSAQPNINPTQIENIDMILPVEDVLEKFKSAVDSMMEKNLINKSQIQTLSKTRDILLPKLMSGEIKI